VHVVLLNQYYAPAEAATAQLLTDLGEYLAREGYRVSVVCSRRSYPDPSVTFPARETLGGVIVYRSWTTGFGRGSRWGRMLDYLVFMVGASRLLLLLRDADVVVSLTTPPLLATAGLAAARLRGAQAVQWVMDVYPDLAFELGVLGRRTLSGRLLAAIAGFTLRRADAVIALGKTMASRLRAAGAPHPTVVHNWADGEAIRPDPAAGDALRVEWNWRDRFVVLYAGNLGLAHEFDTVLGAAETLRDDKGVLFAFVGSGPRRDYVEQEVVRRGLGNVELRPHLPRHRLGESLPAGDVHLVTLRDAVGGLLVPSKIYGILAAGRPTLYVGPQEGEVAEILRRGRCGVQVAIGDSAGLADAIRLYVRDARRRGGDGRRARELFDRRFASERALRAHRRVLDSLVARSRA
jgi:glycosyltransferase involved in cell wall biosynthesis